MAIIEELKKACEETAEFGAELLRKSQMGFDFAPTPNPHNHKAYTRTTARGTLSRIQAKGTTHEDMVKELYGAFDHHDRKGRGGMGIDISHPDYSTPEKYAQTAKNILKFKGHERLGPKGSAEVEAMLKRHIAQIEEQPVTLQAANPGKRYAIPPPPAADQRAAAAAMVKPEMTLAQIKAAIETQHVSTEDFIGDLQPGQITILSTTTGGSQRVKIVPEGRAPNPALAKPIRRTKA